MVVLNVTVNDCTPSTIVLGRRGTYNTEEITFDVSYLIENYGDGIAVLAIKRSQDESAYPAVVAQDGSILTWTVSDTDTAYVGAGECQLMWYVDGGLAKTIIYPMVVMRDILTTAEEQPEGYQTWVDTLTAEGVKTLKNAQDAAQSASDAEAAKDDAITAKEAAEEAAETAQEAVVHAPIIQNGYWYIWNDGQYVDTGVHAEGQKGDKGDTGEKGDTGNGIASITKTGTSGLVDTYTVTYTDGTTTTFTVTNGAKGDKGDTGATGNGIASIEKTGTSGNVDTYTITYTNGQTVTFTVTNGAVSSVAGKTGAVVLDSGDIAYDATETYESGTVGGGLNDLSRQLSDLEDTVSTTQIINTASGAIASFDDGADNMPIRKLVANIEPVQDLHGYANPWPAGGGRNKFNATREPTTINGVTITKVSDGVYRFNGTATAQFDFYFTDALLANWQSISAGSYIANGLPQTSASYALFCCVNIGGSTSYNNVALNGTNISVASDGVVTFFARIYADAVLSNVDFKPMIRLATEADATFAPYSNICPISGHTGMELVRTGKNLYRGTNATDYTVIYGGKNNATSPVEENYTFKPGTYRISFDIDGYVSNPSMFFSYKVNGVWSNPTNRGQVTTFTFTVPENCEHFEIWGYGGSYTGFKNVQIELGSAPATAYEPYTGNQISVTFPSEAGTVYGGTLTIKPDRTGQLVVDRAEVDLGGLTWTGYSSSLNRAYAVISDIKNTSGGNVMPNAICSMLNVITANAFDADTTKDYTICVNNTNHIVWARVLSATSAVDYKTILTGSQFVYELANPIEYQLTESEISGILSTLYGTNNIWSSTGDTEVTYPADTKLYIDGKIAEAIAALQS